MMKFDDLEFLKPTLYSMIMYILYYIIYTPRRMPWFLLGKGFQ